MLRRRAGTTCAVALAATGLVACGGGSSGPSEGPASTAAGTSAQGKGGTRRLTCAPAPTKRTLRVLRKRKTGERFETKLGDAEVRLRIAGARMSDKAVTVGGATATPAGGAAFVGVAIRLENRSSKAIAPADTIARSALLQVGGRTLYPTNFASRCGPLAAGLADRRRVEPPGTEVRAGRTGRSVIAFVVPADARGLTLQLAPQRVSVSLPASS